MKFDYALPKNQVQQWLWMCRLDLYHIRSFDNRDTIEEWAVDLQDGSTSRLIMSQLRINSRLDC